MSPTLATARSLLVPVVVGFFGVYGLALGLYEVVAPGSFFDTIGPFGTRNDHYVRDAATFELANGIVLLLALQRPSWRIPILTFTALRFGIHDLNHLWDIGRADPKWVGFFDFFALALATLSLVAALVAAITDERKQR